VTTDDPTDDPTHSTMDRSAQPEGPTRPAEPPRPVPSRQQLWLVVAGIAALFLMNQVGNIVGPSWVNAHPLGLLVLTGLLRWQILAVNQIDPVWLFVLVGGARLLVADPLFYLLGYWYGDSAFVWIERRSTAMGDGARKLSEYFGYVSWPLVVIMPNNPVCVLAGVNRMKPVVFASLNVAGTLGRLLLIIWLGQKLQDPIDAVLDFIKEYRWYLIGLSIPVVGISVWREASRNLEQVAAIRRSAHDEDHTPDGDR
jgi:membrane protein DedA with SNARE-associated domain